MPSGSSATPTGPPCSSCSNCNAMPCSCTRAAAGSSTSCPVSKRCKSSSSPDARCNWRASCSATRWRGNFSSAWPSGKSNLAEHGDGRQIYEKFVRPTMVDWERVGAHYAVSSLFEIYPEDAQVYGYRAHREDYHLAESGKARLALGRVRLTSDITQESCLLSFGVLHLGDHNVNSGVRKFLGDEPYRELIARPRNRSAGRLSRSHSAHGPPLRPVQLFAAVAFPR